MTVREASLLLLLSVYHVRKLVITGEIVGRKDGRCWVLDDWSVQDWKAKRTMRPQKRGAAWRKGMILSRRQWRCPGCGSINQRDLNAACFRCATKRPEKPEKLKEQTR